MADELTKLIGAITARRIEKDPVNEPGVLDERRFTVEQGGDHYKIKFGGQTVLDPDTKRPVTLPSTPSDARWHTNAVKDLQRVGILPADYGREDQGGLTEEQQAERAEKREQRDAAKERADSVRAVNAERARRRQQDTTVIRDRAERILGGVGVWKQQGVGGKPQGATLSEAARVAWHWAERTGLRPSGNASPASESGAVQSLRLLYKGNTLRDDACDFWRAFLDELERSPNPGRRYAELLREQKGITDQREPVAAPVREAPAAAKPEPEPEQQPEAEPTRPSHDQRMADLRAELVSTEQARVEAVEENEKLRSALELGKQVIAEMEAKAAAAPSVAFENGKLPTLALRSLAEMLGTPVLAPDEGFDDDLFAQLQAKRERAVKLSEEILRLELGVTAHE